MSNYLGYVCVDSLLIYWSVIRHMCFICDIWHIRQKPSREIFESRELTPRRNRFSAYQALNWSEFQFNKPVSSGEPAIDAIVSFGAIHVCARTAINARLIDERKSGTEWPRVAQPAWHRHNQPHGQSSMANCITGKLNKRKAVQTVGARVHFALHWEGCESMYQILYQVFIDSPVHTPEHTFCTNKSLITFFVRRFALFLRYIKLGLTRSGSQWLSDNLRVCASLSMHCLCCTKWKYLSFDQRFSHLLLYLLLVSPYVWNSYSLRYSDNKNHSHL